MIGKVAYEAYRTTSIGVSLVTGLPIPSWEMLTAAIQNAWNVAAAAVLREQPLRPNQASLWALKEAMARLAREQGSMNIGFVEILGSVVSHTSANTVFRFHEVPELVAGTVDPLAPLPPRRYLEIHVFTKGHGIVETSCEMGATDPNEGRPKA